MKDSLMLDKNKIIEIAKQYNLLRNSAYSHENAIHSIASNETGLSDEDVAEAVEEAKIPRSQFSGGFENEQRDVKW